jgi:hypothetical protein
MLDRLATGLGLLGLLVLLALPVSAQEASPAEGDTSPATPEATTPDPGTPDSTTAPAAGGKYDTKLREMEERVVGLKEKIFATKTRLELLKERILQNVVHEAWAIVVHKNEMGKAFNLDQVMYYMDGKKKFFMRNKDGILDKQRTIEIFSGSVVPGNHTISVEMVYKGTGKMFTYLKGYQFKITSKYTFYASQGRIVKIAAVGYEKGDVTYSLDEKPAVKFKVTQYKFDKENLAKLTGEKKPIQGNEEGTEQE